MTLVLAMLMLAIGGISDLNSASAAAADAAAVESQDSSPMEGSPEWERQQYWRAKVREMGEHWSGLDHFELLCEFDAGQRGKAETRLRAAARASSREHAMAHLLVELASSELFRPYREQIRHIARQWVKSSAVPPGGNTGEFASTEAYLRGFVIEFVLEDPPSAADHYASALGAAKAARVRSAQRGGEGMDDLVGAVERDAAERLQRIEILRRRNSAK